MKLEWTRWAGVMLMALGVGRAAAGMSELWQLAYSSMRGWYVAV
jgi:hypothetical protein